MGQIRRPGLTLEQKTELWDRWQRVESLTAIGRAKKLPSELYKSLTWGRGKELTDHRRFSLPYCKYCGDGRVVRRQIIWAKLQPELTGDLAHHSDQKERRFWAKH